MVGRELASLAMYSLLASNRGGVLFVFFPLWMVSAHGVEPAYALAVMSAGYIGASLTGPLAGRWSDRLGRRKAFLLAGELGALPFFIAIPWAPTAALAGAAFIGGELVLSLGAPALNAYIADVSREGERGAGYGWVNAASSAGGVAGFIVVGGLLALFGLAAFFPFVVAVMVVAIGLVLLGVPDRRTAPSRRPSKLREYREVVRFSVAVSIRSIGSGMVGAFYGTFAYLLGATPTEVSVIAVAGLATMAVLSRYGGKLADRTGEMRTILLGTLVSLAGIGLFLAASTWWLILPAQVVRYAGFALLSPAMLAFVARSAPSDRRAEYLGIFTTVNSTLWSVGPIVGAVALALAGPPGLFAVALGLTAVSLFTVEGYYRTRRERGRGPAVPGEELARSTRMSG